MDDNKKDDLNERLNGFLQNVHEQRQERPNQYVIAIYKKGAEPKDDILIGYHLSTFGQVTTDILEAKRYSGLDPYSEQIPVCAKNISVVVDITEEKAKEKIFGALYMEVKGEFYQGVTSSDIYLEAVYLNENTPKQEARRYMIL